MDKTLRHDPYNKLEGFKSENHITNYDIAKTLNITEAAVIKKNNGKSDYFLSEVKKLIETYNMPVHIFLP